MNGSEDKVGVLINMPRELKLSLKCLSERESRSLTGYVVHVLSAHVAAEQCLDHKVLDKK